ncbi:MAG: DUF87 domain-containing protein [Candidatus Bathyarchaeia archaeon]
MEFTLTPSSAHVGIVEGPTTVGGFKAALSAEDIGVHDYLQVQHEGATFLCVIRDCQRAGLKLEADCVVVGQIPRTPFIEGAPVYRAAEGTIRSALELTGTEETGLYVGSLRRLGVKVWLPVKRIGRVFIVGKPGSGKSYTVGVVVEELLKKSVPVVIIDPHGEYSSLKVEAEKPHDGDLVQPRSYIDQIIEFADLEMNPGADLSLAALRVAKAEDLVLPGLCTIVNLRGLGEEDQQPIVSSLLEQLFQASVAGRIPPFYCVLDEAHRFAGKEKTDSSMLVRRFAQEGRKFGANLIVVTQRPQLLDTTVRGLVGTWIIHRLSDPNDVKIVLESGGLEHRWEKEITWFERGEALITGEIVEKIPLVIQVRQRETRHGAPGFNPLDFVKPEAQARAGARIGEKKLELIRREAESFEEQPILPTGLPQCFASPEVTEAVFRGKLPSLLPGFKASLSKARLEYLPAVQFGVHAKVTREDPKISFNAELTGLASLADSRSAIDWRQREVFGVMVDDLDKAVLTAKQPVPGRYGKIRVPLKDQDELGSALERLKGYAALEMTRVVFYHRGLGLFSADGDEASFRKECQAAMRRLLEAKTTELYEGSNAQLQSLESRIKEGEAELRQLAQEARRAELEVEKLHQEARLAARTGRPTRRLEARASALEKRVDAVKARITRVEQTVQTAYKQRAEIRRKNEAALSAATAAVEELKREEIGREVVQPTAEELRIPTIQVVWIPVYRAELTITRGEEERTFTIAWNALNGKGRFGQCETCGLEIKVLSGESFCAECLSPVCAEHALSCSRCGRSLCPNHALSCGSCGRLFCSLERLTRCATCEALTCTDCAGNCVTCGPGRSYCHKHQSRCHLCGGLFCNRHFTDHFLTCSACLQRTCEGVVKRCAFCGDALCPSCVAFCSTCGMPVCKAHSWTCPICGKLQCEGESKSTCIICGRRVCAADSAICPSCGKTACSAHAVTCPTCGQRVCASCTVVYRRFLVKRTGCRLCVKTSPARDGLGVDRG